MYKLLLLLTFASCSTATKLYNKAKDKDPVKVAELAREDWPCITTVQDTTVRIDTVTDVIQVQCPDSVEWRTDTLETSYAVRVPVYVKVPVQREVKTVTVIERIEDSAKIFLMDAEIKYVEKERIAAVERGDRLEQGRNRWRKWCLITWGLLLAGGGIWLIKKKFLP